MGSNTSVVEVKQDKKGGFQVVSRDGKPIAAGGRKQGFKEVEIVYSDGAKASKRTLIAITDSYAAANNKD